jgi:type IV secretion system protein VirD4
MSRAITNKSWGPSHQEMAPPFQKGPSRAWKVVGWFLVAMLAHSVVDPQGGDVLTWSLKALLVGWLTKLLVQAVHDGQIPIGWLLTRVTTEAPEVLPALTGEGSLRPGEAVRAQVARLGGGAYLGVSRRGGWVLADPESAVMVLGPPRSGKTSAVMIPALMATSGAAVSTSTKPDVMCATIRARSEIGEVWLFDPSGTEPLPDGVRRLSWSPVTAAATWDGALVMARAMTAASRVGAGTTNENHWTERAAALLAPLLYAAQLTDRPIEEVLRWTLRQDLAPALEVLADGESAIAADVLIGIERTDTRERSSIFSATAGVLSAYNSDGARQSAAHPNFDPDHFAAATDTVYITSPEQRQAVCAPLIVGLLEQIRHSAYARARTDHAPEPGMLWLLDEVANIAPIHDLPALVSQAGGQNLQVVIGLQDLSQARTRWGADAADGFLSLFQAKVILSGIADTRTLESISLTLGEYDRDIVSQALGHSEPQEWLREPTHSDTVNYHTQRQRVLTPGEIAKLPPGRALLLQGADWQLVEFTKFYEREPWRTVGDIGRAYPTVLGSDDGRYPLQAIMSSRK